MYRPKRNYIAPRVSGTCSYRSWGPTTLCPAFIEDSGLIYRNRHHEKGSLLLHLWVRNWPKTQQKKEPKKVLFYILQG